MSLDAVGIAVAFSVGLFSFLSSCVLLLFPSYLSFITGMSVTTAFVALGASFSVLGQFLLAYRDRIQCAGGVLIVLRGLQIAGVLTLGMFGGTLQWQIRVLVYTNYDQVPNHRHSPSPRTGSLAGLSE